MQWRSRCSTLRNGRRLASRSHCRTRVQAGGCKTEAHIGRVFIDNCIEQFIAGRLDAVTAAMAKYWLTDCQCRIIDQCVQLHGGYGYMQEFPIARMWVDSRVQRIYAGSTRL